MWLKVVESGCTWLNAVDVWWNVWWNFWWNMVECGDIRLQVVACGGIAVAFGGMWWKAVECD